PGLIHVGELIRVGDVWKMTSLPVPLEGNAIQLAPGLVLSEPLAGGVGPAPVATDSSPKMQELIERLRKLMESPPAATAGRPVVEKYQKELEGVLGDLIDESKTDEERMQWRRQLIDAIAGAVQSGFDPSGIARLKKIKSGISKEEPKSPLLAMIDIRLLNAQYFVDIQAEKDNDERAKIHERWMGDIEDFLEANPKAEDAPEAAWQFASNVEFAGKLEKAGKWYERIVENYEDTPAAVRARGALKRLDLVGKTLVLTGTSLSGSTVDVKQFRGKILCVYFWDTSSKPAVEDLPLLKGLYDAHRAQGFEIVGVNLDPVKAAVAPVLTQHGVKWPQIHEPGGPESALAKEFGINSLPTMFIVDADGKVLNRGASIADLKTTLAEKLAKK
ncbi:MAG: redoxin domain-containing protein, partial [Deltaproteobacteria bacterium]